MTALVRHDSLAVTAELQPQRLSLTRRGSCAASQSLQQRANPATVTYSAMAFPSVTTTFTGPGNRGLQVGYNSGSIQTHIHAPSKCPPAPALTKHGANGALLRRTSGDSTTTFVLRAVSPRPRLCRPWNAARLDPRAMLCASIACRAGGPRRGGVSVAEGAKVGARI
jgi:hypothetical protein